MKTTRIGIIGDYNPEYPLHLATDDSIRHAAQALGQPIEFEWLATDLPHDYCGYRGLWCSPGSPYRSLEGAIEGIRYARENGVPFLGTCGGFQHAVLEFSRNVMGVADAAHAEYDPQATTAVVHRLTCSLVGRDGEVQFKGGSRAAHYYGDERRVETYRCSFGMNPTYQEAIETAGLIITGRDADGEARIIELPSHPFI
jgi:CTP synthase (UTP-ammonia lyase)